MNLESFFFKAITWTCQIKPSTLNCIHSRNLIKHIQPTGYSTSAFIFHHSRFRVEYPRFYSATNYQWKRMRNYIEEYKRRLETIIRSNQNDASETLRQSNENETLTLIICVEEDGRLNSRSSSWRFIFYGARLSTG